jgi:hypothetical protein
MPAGQPNRAWFTYVDDSGTHWNKMGKQEAYCQAIDGSAAPVAGQEDYPRASRRRHAREAVFQDPVTFRTSRCIIYTAAAFTALTSGTTISVPVQGDATSITYALANKIPDKVPIASASRHLTVN